MRSIDEIEKVEARCASGEFDSEYAEFIMDNAPGDRLICNGGMLIDAMEDGYLYDDFVDYMIEKILP